MEEIQEMYPAEFKSKDKEMIKIKRDDELKFLTLKISYGNSCKLAYPGASELNDRDNRQKYAITAFIDLGLSQNDCNNLIREVVFRFHPYYQSHQKVVYKWPYQVYTNNFKTDVILFTIKWKDDLKMKDSELIHIISYD